MINLAAGAVVSSQTHRLYDLETMMRWGDHWLVEGTNVYEPGWWGTVDYPPNAVVLLSPLGLLPFGVSHAIWMLVNIGLAILATGDAILAAIASAIALGMLAVSAWPVFRKEHIMLLTLNDAPRSALRYGPRRARRHHAAREGARSRRSRAGPDPVRRPRGGGEEGDD